MSSPRMWNMPSPLVLPNQRNLAIYLTNVLFYMSLKSILSLPGPLPQFVLKNNLFFHKLKILPIYLIGEMSKIKCSYHLWNSPQAPVTMNYFKFLSIYSVHWNPSRIWFWEQISRLIPRDLDLESINDVYNFACMTLSQMILMQMFWEATKF